MQELEQELEKSIQNCENLDDLEKIRLEIFGKKGVITAKLSLIHI